MKYGSNKEKFPRSKKSNKAKLISLALSIHPIFFLPTSSCKNTVLCSRINTVDFIYSLHKKGVNLHTICLRNYLQDNRRIEL